MLIMHFVPECQDLNSLSFHFNLKIVYLFLRGIAGDESTH